MSAVVTLTGRDVERAHSALLTHVRDLEQHLSWLKTQDGHPLPGTEVAIEQITLEIGDYRRLCLEIHKTRFQAKEARP